MTNRAILCTVLAVLVMLPAAAQRPPRLRVISYNILVGFGDHRVGDPYLPGAERKKQITSWLSAQKPDVVALQEMNDYTEAKLRAASAGWGHPYAVLLKKTGFSTALTSRRPIRVIERRIDGQHHGVMLCRTGGVDFVVVHLWPFKGDDVRLREVKVAMELAQASRDAGRPVVMLGDFNAVSPVDIGRFSDAANERYRKWNWEMREGRPDTSVIQAAIDSGLVDLHAKHRQGSDELDLPRIDFAFASPDLAAKSTSCEWITDPEFLRRSDHPPVVTDFEYQTARFPGYRLQDALAYDMDLHVDPAARTIKGEVQYRIKALAGIDRVFLDARRGEQWSVTFVDPEDRPLTARWHKDRVTIDLPEAASTGDEIAFTAHLEGTPPDGFYFKNSRYGKPLGFTDHYSIRARGWLPCEDHPGDRASFKVTLSVPEGNEAVISGNPVENPGGRAGAMTFATRSDIPPYMFAICVGPYARISEAGDDRIWPHFVYERDVAIAKKLLVHHAAWLKAMEETFGPYLYGKYTTIQCPTRWGGFEAPGNVQLAEALFMRPDGGVSTMAHELVHMWFGDGVGYAEWREVWLSEGFASYFGPWLHAMTGGPSLRDGLRALRERWRKSDEGRTLSIRWGDFVHPDNALNSNTYPKGAWILHMLRGELGDERFFSALREFYLAFSGSSVLTTDFVASIEKSTGEKLGWFFDQWLDRVDCPHLRATATENKITIEQTQDGKPYRFRLPLQWKTADGATVKRTFTITERKTELEVKGAQGLVIDPDVELLFRLED